MQNDTREQRQHEADRLCGLLDAALFRRCVIVIQPRSGRNVQWTKIPIPATFPILSEPFMCEPDCEDYGRIGQTYEI